MKKIILALILSLGLVACQNFYVMPALGTGNANAPFVKLSPAGASFTPAGPSGDGVAAPICGQESRCRCE